MMSLSDEIKHMGAPIESDLDICPYCMQEIPFTLVEFWDTRSTLWRIRVAKVVLQSSCHYLASYSGKTGTGQTIEEATLDLKRTHFSKEKVAEQRGKVNDANHTD